MVYNTFLETVKTSLQSRLGEEYSVITHPIPKNNGLTLDGLCIGTSTQEAIPTIYLNSYYTAYENGMSMNDILTDIVNLYETSCFPPEIERKALQSVEFAESRIIYRLINEPANRAILAEVPHMSLPGLDLVLVFYLILGEDDNGQYSAMIKNSQLTLWNLKAEDLLASARINTPWLFPARIRTMTEVLKEMTAEAMGTEYNEHELDHVLQDTGWESPFYVLTNRSGLYGASCICYEGILKDFAASLGQDLLILPSSIHEVLIIPNSEGLSYRDISNMICRINEEEVPVEDHLSNHLYYYSMAEDRLSIAFNSSAPIGTENP
jgi:hypothetical protein